MPFDMKNAISTFSKTMNGVFGAYMDKFLKVFVDDLNVLCERIFANSHSII